MRKNGFTLVEISISVLVLSLLLGIIIFLYQRSNAAFSITVWKQERTAQAERFWTHFRKHAEEATDELVIPDSEMGKPHPKIEKVSNRPILINPMPNVAEKSNLLAWNVSQLKFDFSATMAHSQETSQYYLEKNKKRVALFCKGKEKPIAEIDDVIEISFSMKSLVKADNVSYETEVDGIAPNAIGTLLEISMILAPPKTGLAKDLRIPYNHKFKLNVAAEESTSPMY